MPFQEDSPANGTFATVSGLASVGGDLIPLLEEYISAKYGPQTEPRAEIASGKNTLDFLLEP